MKILTEGKKAGDWCLIATCTGKGNEQNGCNAELELAFEDVRHVTSIDTGSWGDRGEYVNFKCPCCSAVTDLNKKDWPLSKAKLKKWTRRWHDSLYSDSISL